MNQLTAYTLRLGDNCLVLSQRLGEWCGHAPELALLHRHSEVVH